MKMWIDFSPHCYICFYVVLLGKNSLRSPLWSIVPPRTRIVGQYRLWAMYADVVLPHPQLVVPPMVADREQQPYEVLLVALAYDRHADLRMLERAVIVRLLVGVCAVYWRGVHFHNYCSFWYSPHSLGLSANCFIGLSGCSPLRHSPIKYSPVSSLRLIPSVSLRKCLHSLQ